MLRVHFITKIIKASMDPVSIPSSTLHLSFCSLSFTWFPISTSVKINPDFSELVLWWSFKRHTDFLIFWGPVLTLCAAERKIFQVVKEKSQINLLDCWLWFSGSLLIDGSVDRWQFLFLQQILTLLLRKPKVWIKSQSFFPSGWLLCGQIFHKLHLAHVVQTCKHPGQTCCQKVHRVTDPPTGAPTSQ